MKKFILIFLLSNLLFISGCGMLPSLPSITPIDLTANVAGEQQVEDNLVGEINKVKVNKANSVVNNITEINALMIILLVLGWMLPAPNVIIKSLCSGVVTVFKGIGNFILKLFNRNINDKDV